MPRGKGYKKRPMRRRVYRRRKRAPAKSRGLNAKERKQVLVLAKSAHIKLEPPKRHEYPIGAFHNTPSNYEYGQPMLTMLIGGITEFGGLRMVAQTTSVTLGHILQGAAADQRLGNEIYLRGMKYNFVISWSPQNLVSDTEVKFCLVSTLNDPSGGNLSWIPGVPQDATSHIPSLLCPPTNTMGYRYRTSQINRDNAKLDLSEYKVHWQRTFNCKQDDDIEYRQKKIEIAEMFKKPKLKVWDPSQPNTSGAWSGRRYFLLYNSTAPTTATTTHRDCPAVHARIWTYFRDRGE